MSFEAAVATAGLAGIHRKVAGGERLTFDDGVTLYACDDLPVLAWLANIVRERLHGDATYYVRNQHVNYTNICNKLCKFCSFYVTPKDERGYVLQPQQAAARVREYADAPITEIHMVGGVNPRLPYEYYLDLLRAMKEARPQAHLKAFTMIELAQIQRIARRPLEEVLADLKEAGLESIPGGGAEVFSDRVQEDLFWTKSDSEDWLRIAAAAHRAGLPTNATMLYGHVENTGEKVYHLARLRDLQEETCGFLAYIPLSFHPGTHRHRPSARTLRGSRSQGDRRRAPHARQLPAHQDLLDHEHDRGLAGRPVVRRQRHRRHGDGLRDHAAQLRGDAAAPVAG